MKVDYDPATNSTTMPPPWTRCIVCDDEKGARGATHDTAHDVMLCDECARDGSAVRAAERKVEEAKAIRKLVGSLR